MIVPNKCRTKLILQHIEIASIFMIQKLKMNGYLRSKKCSSKHCCLLKCEMRGICFTGGEFTNEVEDKTDMINNSSNFANFQAGKFRAKANTHFELLLSTESTENRKYFSFMKY